MKKKKDNTILYVGTAALAFFIFGKNESEPFDPTDYKWYNIPNYSQNPVPGPALHQVLPPLGYYYFAGFGSADGWYHRVDLEGAGWTFVNGKWLPPQDGANGANTLNTISNILDVAVTVAPNFIPE